MCPGYAVTTLSSVKFKLHDLMESGLERPKQVLGNKTYVRDTVSSTPARDGGCHLNCFIFFYKDYILHVRGFLMKNLDYLCREVYIGVSPPVFIAILPHTGTGTRPLSISIT